ncbi:MAG: hypothetical protein AAF636_21145 [Pseudomonadota bacterium]
MRRILTLACAILLAAPAAQASTFKISTALDFSGANLSANEQFVFRKLVDQATAFWTTNITGYQVNDPFLRGVTVPISFNRLRRTTIAQTSDDLIWDGVQTSNGVTYSETQSIVVNTQFLSQAISDRGFGRSILIHEFAHAIGFGLRWQDNGVYSEGTGQYTGVNAADAYRAEFDPAATFVPVTNGTNRSGADDLHWDEDWAGGSDAIMTPFLDKDSFVSTTTLLSFRDIGYTTRDEVIVAPIPLPAGLWVYLTGLFGLFFSYVVGRTPTENSVTRYVGSPACPGG